MIYRINYTSDFTPDLVNKIVESIAEEGKDIQLNTYYRPKEQTGTPADNGGLNYLDYPGVTWFHPSKSVAFGIPLSEQWMIHIDVHSLAGKVFIEYLRREFPAGDGDSWAIYDTKRRPMLGAGHVDNMFISDRFINLVPETGKDYHPYSPEHMGTTRPWDLCDPLYDGPVEEVQLPSEFYRAKVRDPSKPLPKFPRKLERAILGALKEDFKNNQK